MKKTLEELRQERKIARRREYQRNWWALKRANDPEYRERKNALVRERYANDPEYRERKNALVCERYANDPEYRKRDNARSAARSRKASGGAPRRA
jgi:hypothetical protein